jgi:hypothetical protein
MLIERGIDIRRVNCIASFKVIREEEWDLLGWNIDIGSNKKI